MTQSPKLVVASFDPSLETNAGVTLSFIKTANERRIDRAQTVARRKIAFARLNGGYPETDDAADDFCVALADCKKATSDLAVSSDRAFGSKKALAERLSRSLSKSCVVIAGQLAIEFDPACIGAERIRSICPIADVEGLDAVNVENDSESESPPVRAVSNLERVALYADEIEFKAGRAFILSNASKRQAIAECIAGCLFSVSQINERVCFEVHTHELLSV